jgi:uncharacterized membrane protein YfcA
VLGNLRLPLIVAIAASPAAAAGANVAISGAAAAAAASAHLRAGRVNPRLFWLMAPPSFVGGLIGGLVSGLLPSRLLLAIIALVVLYGAVEVARHDPRPPAERADTLHVAPAIASGLAVGILGGIVGLILGTLRLPAMLKWVGADARSAVATNSALGLVLAIGAVIGHVNGEIDWAIAAIGSAAAIPGALLGARFVGRVGERTLLRAVAVVLAISGLAMLVAAIAG